MLRRGAWRFLVVAFRDVSQNKLLSTYKKGISFLNPKMQSSLDTRFAPIRWLRLLLVVLQCKNNLISIPLEKLCFFDRNLKRAFF